MASDKDQFNTRPDAETWDRIRALKGRVEAAYGIPVSFTDLVRLAMIELEKKFPPDDRPKKK